ncbi:MAG TPA: (2Fe-2S)-binding protein [Pyrinomonadaceae bacterium]
MITLIINGKTTEAEEGVTVAAAIMNAGLQSFRRSVNGRPRAPLCGMGICFECRVSIDGVPHSRSCAIFARDGMEVAADE